MADTSIGTILLAFGMPGGWEWVVILLIGLLIFGRRLPDVGRSIGKSIVEFKRGVKGIHEEIDAESSRPAADDPAQLTDETGKRVETTEEMPSRHDEAGT
ncbi:MAG: twin-arginine translocase TatA/TatE family subunit [Phycisphaerales bacterium]|jgi:sec-independent protein translocase protein TatA|nr:twin-arginine translocase TatA/TatE family subunit [Phycisphaerales bacterium]MDP6889708.1 twin-arginine translocase TatA/TatE family subunit [Phycisphaerales bacterium]